MSTDVVERLKTQIAVWPNDKTCVDALAEIARLRAALEEISMLKAEDMYRAGDDNTAAYLAREALGNAAQAESEMIEGKGASLVVGSEQRVGASNTRPSAFPPPPASEPAGAKRAYAVEQLLIRASEARLQKDADFYRELADIIAEPEPAGAPSEEDVARWLAEDRKLPYVPETLASLIHRAILALLRRTKE